MKRGKSHWQSLSDMHRNHNISQQKIVYGRYLADLSNTLIEFIEYV